MPVDTILPLREHTITLRIGLAHDCSRFVLLNTASLRFQPTKRPQISSQKPKSKTALPKATPPIAVQPAPTQAPPNNTSRPPPKTSLADWTANDEDEDVNGFYGGEKRQRGGRKKRKKNKEESHVPQNWDDIYDPSRPNNYEEYKNSDEKIREVREWKDRLYAHRMARQRSDYTDSDDDTASKPQMNSESASFTLKVAMLSLQRSICASTHVIRSSTESQHGSFGSR